MKNSFFLGFLFAISIISKSNACIVTLAKTIEYSCPAVTYDIDDCLKQIGGKVGDLITSPAMIHNMTNGNSFYCPSHESCIQLKDLSITNCIMTPLPRKDDESAEYKSHIFVSDHPMPNEKDNSSSNELDHNRKKTTTRSLLKTRENVDLPLRCAVTSRTQSNGSEHGGIYIVNPIQCTILEDSIVIVNAEVNRGNCPLMGPTAQSLVKITQGMLSYALDPKKILFNRKWKFGETFEIPGWHDCATPIEWKIWLKDGREFVWNK